MTYRILAQMSMSALLPSGKLPTTLVRRRTSLLRRSIMLFVRIRRRCSGGLFLFNCLLRF